MLRIQNGAGKKFTSKNFQEVIYVHGLRLALSTPDHNEMNVQVEGTWRTFGALANAIMVDARVSEEYIHFAFMYTTYHIFPVLPIKHLVNQDDKPATPYKPAAIKNPSISNLHVLFSHGSTAY